MLDLDLLSYWTLQSFPYIFTPINACGIDRLPPEECRTEPVDLHTLYYVLSGSATLHFQNERKKIDRKFLAEKQDLFYFEPLGTLTVKNASEDFSALYVRFCIKTADQSPEDMAYPDAVAAPLKDLYVELPLCCSVELTSWEYQLLERMRKNQLAGGVGCRLSQQTLLAQLLVHLVHKYPPTPQLIDCIMFNSDLDEGRPLRKGRVLDLSQVEIWDGQPGETGSHLLRTMKPDRYFVGATDGPASVAEYDFDKAPPDIPGTYVGHIRTAQDTSYYIFLWPDHGVKPLDISFYRNNRIYIRLFARSNQPGTVGIALYSTSEWRRSGSSFAIEQPECFREYVVPVLRTHLHSAVSPHILKAIAYIKENYAENIRISDIAAALYIHPNYLSSIFTKQMGISLVAYITNYRLLVAQKMLMETDLSVEKIALEVGFYDVQHFSRVFKSRVGLTPQMFRVANRPSPEP